MWGRNYDSFFDKLYCFFIGKQILPLKNRQNRSEIVRNCRFYEKKQEIESNHFEVAGELAHISACIVSIAGRYSLVEFLSCRRRYPLLTETVVRCMLSCDSRIWLAMKKSCGKVRSPDLFPCMEAGERRIFW